MGLRETSRRRRHEREEEGWPPPPPGRWRHSLIANHHAIGIVDALVLAPIGALIVVGDRRHLLAWLLLADGLVLGALNVAEQYAPLALGLTTRQLSLPGGKLASWVASWAFVPGIVIGVVFLVLLFPEGRLPSRRWWPLGLAGAAALVVPTVVLAVGTWPLRGPELVTPEGRGTGPCHRRVRDHAHDDTGAGSHQRGRAGAAVPPRRGGAAPADQVVAYPAAPSVPLGMFAQVPPYGPYLEFLGAALTIERFSARLRDQVDLDTLSAELLAVVDHTMRPTATSLWLRPSAADSAQSAPLARSRPD